MKRLSLFTICIVTAMQSIAQQDPQYNLYQFNQMVINPAYAGARDAIAIVGSVRQQWSGFDGAPQTSCFSVHSPILKNKMGVGLTVVQDAMGPRKMFGANANAAYILKLNDKWKLSFGVSGGYNRYQFDFSKLSFKTTESSVSQPFENITKGILDVNSGLFLRSNTFFAGLSVTHLTDPTLYTINNSANSELSYRLHTHLFLTLGKSFKLNDNVVFAPTFLLKNAGPAGSADLNLNFFLFKKLWLGVFVRGGYGPGFLLQYYVTDKFRVAYSYDTGAKDARNLGPSHEVMLGFDLAPKKVSKVISPRFL